MIEFASNPVKVGVALLALSLSFWAYYKMRKPKMTPTRRAALTYFHLAMLFFPFLFFVYSMDCTAIGRYCAGMGLLETAALSLPVALAQSRLSASFSRCFENAAFFEDPATRKRA